MNEEQVSEFFRVWQELTQENKLAVVEHARTLLVNQHIKQNREPIPDDKVEDA